jgi:hypothetical protein
VERGGRGGRPVLFRTQAAARSRRRREDLAHTGFQLLFFAKVGTPPIAGYCDPLATADVRMDIRREADGDWRIAMFDSGQVFQRG